MVKPLSSKVIWVFYLTLAIFVYTLSLYALSYVHPSILIVTLVYMPYKHLMEVIYSVKHICYYILVLVPL